MWHGNAGVVGQCGRYIGEHVLGAITIGNVGDVKESTITMREHVPFAIHTDISYRYKQVMAPDEE